MNLCDRNISLRVKGRVHKTVVRPAMMYGAATWAAQRKRRRIISLTFFNIAYI